MKNLYLFTTAMTVSFLVACSDGDNTTTYVNEDIATLNSPAQGELPACTADDNGKFFFMPGTKDVVLCSRGAWVSLASNPVSHKDSVGSASDTTVEKKGSVTNLSAEEIEACTASFDSTDLHSVTIDCGSFSVVTNVYPDEETSIIKGDDIVDARDSTVYRTVVIGKQTWLRDNASYEVGGSKECSYINCGLLYTWDAAQEACPEGTHLPTEEEFQELVHYVNSVNGDTPTGKDLIARYDKDYKYLGNDFFGFEAHAILPYGESQFWSSSEDSTNTSNARYFRVMPSAAGVQTKAKTEQIAVRCIVGK
jgi:uncharacterized protein (TIGR02145 family)